MSGAGAPETRNIDGRGLNVVIVAGTWHETISNGLIAGAERVLDEAKATHRLVRVPGSFELAIAAQAAFAGGADAVVALGAVIIRGALRTSSTSRRRPPTASPASPSMPASLSDSVCSPSTTSSRVSTAPVSKAPRRTRAPKPPMPRLRTALVTRELRG